MISPRKQHKPPPLPYNIHYSWIILFSSFCSIAACLGFGRFALGMLLPSMATALSLSNSQTGFIGTINFIGYLLSVLIVGKVSQHVSPRTLIPASLALVGLSMIILSQSHSIATLSLCYFFTGFGSGFANVLTMALVLRWFVPQESGRACGLVVGGSGFAILTAGQLIPLINTLFDENGWQISWIVLGCFVLVAAILNLLLIRNTPSDIGLNPYQKKYSKNSPSPSKDESHQITRPKSSIIYHLGFIYFCFGFTYVIYATFLVSTLVQEMGFSERSAGLFWSLVGVLSLFSGPLFGSLSDKIGRKQCLALVFSLQTISYFLIGLQVQDILIISITLFGLTAWSIPSIMTATVGDYVGSTLAAQVFGFVTFLFGIGQISGPFLAGIMTDIWGSFSYSFLGASCVTSIAVITSLFLKPPR